MSAVEPHQAQARMNANTRLAELPGPAGRLALAIDDPQGLPASAWRGVAVICHPHPLYGGTMDNKVVQTLARALVQLGWQTVRFNFRGVGGSQGEWAEGPGEVDDALAVVAAQRQPDRPLLLGGFSFGGYVAAAAADRLAATEAAQHLVLVAPATTRFAVPARVADDTLVIHGEQDDVVPLQATLDWARPQSLPVVVVPGAGHFFHGQLPVLKRLVLANLRP